MPPSLRPIDQRNRQFFSQMTKVLIVDDEVEVRQFLSRSLAECGYVIREARDGSEALACLATEHPDVVITDLLMPVMDGFELALRIRANPDHAATEVIFFTGRASPRQIQAMAETAGVAQIVTKPATIHEVQEAVDAAVHRKHPAAVAEPRALTTEEHRAFMEQIAAGESGPPAVEPPHGESDRKFRVLFARSLDAILLFTTDGQCLEANPAALELLGYDWDALVKLTLWDLTPPENVPAAREFWRQFLDAGRIQGKYQLLHRDGSRRDVGVSAVANLDDAVHLTMWRGGSSS